MYFGLGERAGDTSILERRPTDAAFVCFLVELKRNLNMSASRMTEKARGIRKAVAGRGASGLNRLFPNCSFS
jgi:hypothetical protein